MVEHYSSRVESCSPYGIALSAKRDMNEQPQDEISIGDPEEVVVIGNPEAKP